MDFMTKRASGLAACFALALTMLAGCRDEDESIATAAAAATAPAAATAAAAAAAAAGPAASGVGTKSVVINWTAPTEYEDGSPFIDLAGYQIWYGVTPGSYSNLVDIAPGTTSHKVHSLAATTYYFSITAYNHEGVESTLSNELMIRLN